VDDSGFLGLKNPVNVSVSCVSRFFLGAVVLVDGFGVNMLPSSVTFPFVIPVVVRGDTGGVFGGVLDEPDGVCGGAGSVAPPAGGSFFNSDSWGSFFNSDSCGS
jgi:hypothetical protein